MTKFDRAQLVAFLRALDRNLGQPSRAVVIGGAVAAVAYDSGTKTADIDLFSGISKEILEAAFRRSELVSVDVEDVAFVTDGLEVVLNRSKTDQEGEGRKIGIPFGSSPRRVPFGP